MGKCTGQCSRMTLSYDFAFLALVRITFMRDTVSFGQKRCIAHPLKKRNYMKHNPSLSYCAGAAALLNYHKIADDLSDEKGFKKLRAMLVYPFVRHARKKALRAGLSELDEKISEGLRQLSELESSELVSVDAPAELFGDILAHIISFGLDGSDARIAFTLGKTVGKWIYISDALDDLEEDAEKGRYNPFFLLYGKKLPDERQREDIRSALKMTLYDAEAAIDLMSFENDDIKNIVLNILYLGLPLRIEQIEKDRCKGHRKNKCKNTNEHKERTDKIDD